MHVSGDRVGIQANRSIEQFQFWLSKKEIFSFVPPLKSGVEVSFHPAQVGTCLSIFLGQLTVRIFSFSRFGSGPVLMIYRQTKVWAR